MAVCDPAAATQCDVFDLGGLSGFVLIISFEAVTVTNWNRFFLSIFFYLKQLFCLPGFFSHIARVHLHLLVQLFMVSIIEELFYGFNN